MPATISFRCAACNASLKAATKLAHRSGPCPACGHRVIVPPKPLQDAGPVLVFDDRPTPPYPEFR
jgi:DNA-directed RNA polymerase subunit RPC12/RpoP